MEETSFSDNDSLAEFISANTRQVSSLQDEIADYDLEPNSVLQSGHLVSFQKIAKTVRLELHELAFMAGRPTQRTNHLVRRQMSALDDYLAALMRDREHRLRQGTNAVGTREYIRDEDVLTADVTKLRNELTELLVFPDDTLDKSEL